MANQSIEVNLHDCDLQSTDKNMDPSPEAVQSATANPKTDTI